LSFTMSVSHAIRAASWRISALPSRLILVRNAPRALLRGVLLDTYVVTIRSGDYEPALDSGACCVCVDRENCASGPLVIEVHRNLPDIERSGSEHWSIEQLNSV
jgi:hypothetical protein